ncbi:inner membrane protein [Buchnera aphidicola (Nipponaphis monzeni)]|uniref:Inner membrane protein n=1 Tax=Buchnera aphidicola (Nipponaphis monzeni) TaxID=2495405 RepID=A0A455T9V6_9GAMM|nr:AI-2E family transporter YdiK [Buchnera aphidicola]BBI01112.1 inner membrane protein [Buchnera aphidicola (Nipponaphis monzeni)]
MQNPKKNMDLPKVIFSLVFVICMIIASFWIVRPFVLGFIWASMIVIATWPFMIKLQSWFGGQRSFAVIIMTLSLLLLFIIPSVILVHIIINNSIPLIHLLSSGKFKFPTLIWLQDCPIIGNKLLHNYKKIINGGGNNIINQLQPYIGRTTEFFFIQASHFGRFIIHLGFMLVFSVILYWNGEKVTNIIRHVAFKLASQSGDAVVLLTGQVIRSVALGVVVTALLQGLLGWFGLIISGIPYSVLFMILTILFCLIQLGPLPILVPIAIWLYWNNNIIWGTFLLVWSGIICILDNILRPMLIKIGIDLPALLILSGVIGGILAFGIIGIFIGPVILIISYRMIASWMYEAPISKILVQHSTKKIPHKKKKTKY